MEWIKKFDLFLFDFDGLLVNTEEMHYQAYKQMMLQYGVTLKWDFTRYCQAAHYEATLLRDQIAAEYPELLAKEPSWEVLYKEKQRLVLKLIVEGKAHLMPGVEKLLKALEEANIARAVVTHSPQALIELVKIQNPPLKTLPDWITREHYSRPKPDPECYFYAIGKLAQPGARIIGFEDTPRGLMALSKTSALPVLICTTPYPEIPSFVAQGAKHFKSLENVSL